jgi:hypothetical protein
MAGNTPMPIHLAEAISDAEVLLALDPEELAAELLFLLQNRPDRRPIHPRNSSVSTALLRAPKSTRKRSGTRLMLHFPRPSHCFKHKRYSFQIRDPFLKTVG